MKAEEFREFGKAAVDFIADYIENIRDVEVLPSVNPGYLVQSVPTEIPENSENWRVIMADINKIILPGITHWQSPNFHAYYPTASSYPSIVGEMLSAGFSVIGFSWICSPACTELEVVVMDWLAKFLNLPQHFLHSSSGSGGGIIQGSASESILVAVLAAREQTVKRVKQEHPEWSESDIRGKLIAYSSDQSNSCVEKAGLLAAVPFKLLPTDKDCILRGDQLEEAMSKDLNNGLIPIICVANVGTTGTCAFDDVASLGPICNANNIWLHVDAAYAGAGFAVEEYSHLRNGLELADSLNFNLHKFLMVNFDCAAMWIRDANLVIDSFNVDRIYLKHQYEGLSKIPDFRHWQIPLGRRFRALKVWITLRTVGAQGIKDNIHKHMSLAERFENYVINDNRFEIFAKRALGLVCFRLKGDNDLNSNLIKKITENKKIYMVQGKYKNTNFLRFCVCGMDTKEKDIDFAWNEIQKQSVLVLQEADDLLNGNYMKDLHIKHDSEKHKIMLDSENTILSVDSN
ncbi:amd family protein [Megaselia abdita]